MSQSDLNKVLSASSPIFPEVADNREIQLAQPGVIGKPCSSLIERFFGVVEVLNRDQDCKGPLSDVPDCRDVNFERFISQLLKYGVLISSSLVLMGGMLYLFKHGSEAADYHFFHGEPQAYRSPMGVISAIAAGQRRGLIQLGLLGLIATPILRVMFSLFVFSWRRDYPFILVTGVVMSGLLYGLISAYFYQ
jgi:uncharacterized membrane protein